ncbi:MAG: penicillin-binding protein, partial [Rhodoblastus sp.]|nr:penicillin-binding protein [Rhodoblastus sp.]
GWQAAGKTGTSQDFRDAWFVGYTSALVTGVWLGNDDSSATKHASGGNLPVEVWSKYMRAALKGQPVAALPGGAWRPANLPAPAPAIPVARGPDPAGPSGGFGSPAATPPMHTAGAPMQLGRDSRPRSVDDLLPPGEIGARSAAREHEPREKSFLEKLFGG